MLCEGTVSKFSMGRSTGISIKNWKTRHMILTKDSLQYMERPGAEPKHNMHANAISVIWTKPTAKDHPRADPSKPMILLRVWSNGVFDLLIDCLTQLEKDKWVNAFKQLLGKSKGVQIV